MKNTEDKEVIMRPLTIEDAKTMTLAGVKKYNEIREKQIKENLLKNNK